MGIATEFRGKEAVEFRKQTSAAKQEIRKKITFDLLVKLLKQNRDCFKRYVTRSSKDEFRHPAFPEIFYYCHYHIGRIGEYEWFFEDEEDTVIMYRSKSLRSLPVVEMFGCEISMAQIRAIVEYLDGAKLVKGADKAIKVPKNFYVFEFTAQEKSWPGGHEVGKTSGMVPPFQAKNLKDAIRIMKTWSDHWSFKDISNVRVYTHEGCLKLKSTLLESAHTEKWNADLSDYDYELTA